MGQDIVASAKDIIVTQQKEKSGLDVTGHERGVIKDVTQHYKALQAQVQSLEDKLELILRKLN